MTVSESPTLITDPPPADSVGLTPMMTQYIKVKQDNPDCLLFYRMGDFYEMFFQDAVDAARALDITLTNRGKINNLDVPMCGVPFHAAETYLARLVDKGFRIAICEQSESAEIAKKRGNKGPLKRDVVRIVTPGTLVEDDYLTPRENNFLVALFETDTEQAIAWVDLSTGALLAETIADGRLHETLARLAPAELIISDPAGANHSFADDDTKGLVGSLALQPAVHFDSAKGKRRLLELYNVSTLDGMADLSRVELAAMAGLMAYIDRTQKDRDLVFKPVRRMQADDIMEIDPASRRSLEITRTLSGNRQGSLLSVIDLTKSAVGGRLMANRLSAPTTDKQIINDRLDLTSALLIDDQFLDKLQDALTHMPDLERALSRLSLDHGGPRDLNTIAMGLKSAATIAQAIEGRIGGVFAQSQFDAMAITLKKPAQIIAKLTEMLDDNLPMLARDGGFIRQGADPALDELRSLRDDCRRHIAQLQARYSEATGVASLKIKHNNVLGYHIEVRSNHADALTGQEDFIHRQTTAQTVRFTTTELGEMEQKIDSAAQRALVLELEHFEQLSALVLEARSDIIPIAEDTAALDVAHATALLAKKWRYCRPTLTDSMDFCVRDGRHPVVERMLDKQESSPFTTNDCTLGADDRIWLLTGPNMAGKSTFLRQNAQIAIMAQAGLFVPAASAEIGIIDRLFCRVGASDDLATGRSTFMVEMIETAAILNRSSARAFVILDEIGRGTATYDGLSLAWAAVEHLHEVNGCRVLFATHYHELNELRGRLDGLSSHSMKVKEWQGEVVFLHEVTEGSADRSYGIHVAKLAGVPAMAIARAEEVLERLISENKSENMAIDNLPLFDTAPPPPANIKASQVDAFVDELLPDTMTPRAALEALYKLKALRDEEKN